jgi:mRNA-degrading endonuclease YafQ of YafQ-DinJ toxin-antitoxin module
VYYNEETSILVAYSPNCFVIYKKTDVQGLNKLNCILNHHPENMKELADVKDHSFTNNFSGAQIILVTEDTKLIFIKFVRKNVKLNYSYEKVSERLIENLAYQNSICEIKYFMMLKVYLVLHNKGIMIYDTDLSTLIHKYKLDEDPSRVMLIN